MDFFDSVPRPARPEPTFRPLRPLWMKPEFVLPGSVAADLVLIRTDEITVAIGVLRAYPTGFEFTVESRVRHPERHDRLGARARIGRRPEQDAEREGLRLGLTFADGRGGTTAETGHSLCDDIEPDKLAIIQGGGSGNARTWSSRFWVYPLPPGGPVEFRASWPAYGAAEAQVELDGAVIRDAAQRAVVLWPEDDDAPLGGASMGTATGRPADAPDAPDAPSQP
jgi:hypothetical protein